jgi:hypothetical protein
MKRYRLKRPALALAVIAIVIGAVGPSASALQVGPLFVDIQVDTSNWSACGIVSDDLTHANYTAVLTATGFQSSVSQNGVILSEASGSGNPAQPCTSGGFDSSISAVEYTLEWTSIAGTTGTLTKTCAETDLMLSDTILPDVVAGGPIKDVLDRALALNRPVCTLS